MLKIDGTTIILTRGDTLSSGKLIDISGWYMTAS